MLRKNLWTIYPDKMNAKQKAVLRAFLLGNPDMPFLEKDTTYNIALSDGKSDQKTLYEFKLANNLVARDRKDNKSGTRYEVLNNAYLPLGVGGNGVVRQSNGILAPEHSPLFFKPKTRAVKIQTNEADAHEEYAMTKRVPHLHAKPLTKAITSLGQRRSRPQFFMAEKLIPGANLYKIIQNESSGQQIIGTNQRIALSINILLAIQQQAHDIGLIHGDIKSENIMVDLTTNSVNLVDYRFSRPTSSLFTTYGPCGTLITAPPEQLPECPADFKISTPKSDNYSAGKTLAEFWCADAEVNLISADNMHKQLQLFISYAKNDTAFNYTNFLEGDLESQHADKIKHMFEQLSRANPADRWELTQAINCLQEIQEERLSNRAQKKLRSGKEY